MTPDTAALRRDHYDYDADGHCDDCGERHPCTVRALCDAADEVERLTSKYEEWESMHSACLALREDVARHEREAAVLNESIERHARDLDAAGESLRRVAAERDAARTALAAEAAKFQAETRVSTFLAERLRDALGAATRCDRCQTARGRWVARSEDGHRVEWVCDACLDGTRADAPVVIAPLDRHASDEGS